MIMPLRYTDTSVAKEGLRMVAYLAWAIPMRSGLTGLCREKKRSPFTIFMSAALWQANLPVQLDLVTVRDAAAQEDALQSVVGNYVPDRPTVEVSVNVKRFHLSSSFPWSHRRSQQYLLKVIVVEYYCISWP